MVKRRVNSRVLSCTGLCLAFTLTILFLPALSVAQDSVYANAAPQTPKAEKDNPSVPGKPTVDIPSGKNTPSIPTVTRDSEADNSLFSDENRPDTKTVFSQKNVNGPNLENQLIGKKREKSDNFTKNERSGYSMPSLWQTVGSLLIVLALIVAVAYFFRRFSINSHRKFAPVGIEIVARHNINPKQSLCLVKLGGRLLLVGLSPNHMAALNTIDDPDEVAHLTGLAEESKPDSITNTFGRFFHRESDIYQDGEAPVDDDNFRADKTPHWHQARGELTSLLDKVKGLSRIRFRS